MKKITLVLTFCLIVSSWSYGQCTIASYQYPTSTVTISNSPGPQTIATNNWRQNEYSVLEGLVIGESYTVFTDIATFITVTEADGTTVINFGDNSVSFVATTTGIVCYWSADSACTSGDNTNVHTQIECTTCICNFTFAPSCVTEITPVNNDASATVGPGGSVTFEWNSDPNAEGYELFINNFSQGMRESGITFTGFDYGVAYTWSVVPMNCVGTANNCATWSFTTEACTETAAPGVQASNPFPADGATAVSIQGPDGGLDFDWTGSTNPEDFYTLNIGTTNPPTQALAGVEPGETITGLQVSTTYYWSIDVVNCFDSTPGTTVWSFTTDAQLSVSDNEFESFKVFPNPTSNVLNVKTTADIDNIDVFNLLGKKVLSFKGDNLSENSIDISELPGGLYLVKISSGKNSKTIKVTKE